MEPLNPGTFGTLIAVLWTVYLSECFVRSAPGSWVFRPGRPGPFQGRSEPDLSYFGGRVGFIWASVFPWRIAYRVKPLDATYLGERPTLQARGILMLRILSTILFTLVMLVFPVLLWTEYFVPALPMFASAVVFTWIATLACYFATHKRLYGRMPEAEPWVMVTLSPLALMRAPLLVSLDAAPFTHPVVMADMLCADEEFLRIARIWYHDAPALRQKLCRLAAKRGHLDTLTAPPADSEDDVSVFCPRCHATYLLGAVKCLDCDDTRLLPLPNARREAAARVALPPRH